MSFDDLCTVNEIQSMSQRLEVARMLGKGNTYNQIEAETELARLRSHVLSVV